MQLAIQQAKKANIFNEVPVGAVLINENNGKILSAHHNKNIILNNPIKHAEILVIEEACFIRKSKHLLDTAIYITLEPCAMCAAAISEARINKIYFGAYDIKKGAIENGVRIFNNNNYFIPEIYGGIKEKECSLLLQKFFSSKRKLT